MTYDLKYEYYLVKSKKKKIRGSPNELNEGRESPMVRKVSIFLLETMAELL